MQKILIMCALLAILAVAVVAWFASLAQGAASSRPSPCRVPHGSMWELSEKCLLTCPSPNCSYSFDTIRVHAGGELLIDERVASTKIYARIFVVHGKLVAGTKERPFAADFEIVLTGDSSDQDDAAIAKEELIHGSGRLPYSKVLLSGAGSLVSLHGLPKTSWVKLAGTAAAGSSEIELAEMPSGWQVGDRLVVPSTAMVKSGSSENEIVTLKALNKTLGGKTILSIEKALQFEHYGASPDIRLNGEVGVLSHNVRIRGDNTDDDHRICLQEMMGNFDRANLVRIRKHCYGGQTAALSGASFQVSHVELTRMGQATRIARYPIHWHLAADQSELNSYATGNSIWESYQRCVTIHGTWGAVVQENVCYHTYGHAVYLEDAIEHNNSFVRNLVVGIRRGPMVCTDSQVGPSAFWITNPNNTFTDNLAVDIGNAYGGVGYWIVSGGSTLKENGPSYIGTDFWTKDYQEKVAGSVFNPSRMVFAASLDDGEHNFSASARFLPKKSLQRLHKIHEGTPSWMLGQQQARTPLKEFRGNGVRGSYRGVHIDGFVTSSIPGEVGDVLHDPEDVHVFGTNDGTCDYFPAGHLAISYAQGMHVYAPTHFTYDDQGRAQNFSPTWSIVDGLHVSRCYDAWWSRAARVNITNSIFAHNWVGMTNHIPGNNFCPGTGSPSNPGLANHVVNSLFIGHGDEVVNKQLCSAGSNIQWMFAGESPAAIRQYDGAFWLSNSRWVNMSTVACPSPLQDIQSNDTQNSFDALPSARGSTANLTSLRALGDTHNATPPWPPILNYTGKAIRTLPYALVAARQWDCNGKFPVHLYNSWPLGASPEDVSGAWAWALPHIEELKSQNLAQFTGSASCARGPTGGVVDMTGTLDPLHPSVPAAYFPASGSLANPGELATYSAEALGGMMYKPVGQAAKARVASFAWAANVQREPDYAHTCGYCFYDEKGSCPSGDRSDLVI